MKYTKHFTIEGFICLLCLAHVFDASAQVCDPAVAPGSPMSTIIPGSGVKLSWEIVPGSVGVQVALTEPDATVLQRRIFGFERDKVTIPETVIGPGLYTWRVQAACSTIPPYDVTLNSDQGHFLVNTVTCPATVMDIDGNTYSVVPIGTQCWMAENLRVKHFQDGTEIDEVRLNSHWTMANFGGWCGYGNSSANETIYGLLYNRFAVAAPQGLCPLGWHVPSDAEMDALSNLVGGSAGGLHLKSSTSWSASSGGGTNFSGFSALPAGYRNGSDGSFNSLGSATRIWSNSESSPTLFIARALTSISGNFASIFSIPRSGYSVRCLKD